MGSYRARLSIAMMLVVVVLTAIGLFLTERKINIESRRDLLQDFRNELATLDRLREIRQTALAERCQALVERPRIHAALEDNAVDLLYPSARDELRDILADANGTGEGALKAKFYRFLDGKGSVIVPPEGADVGKLTSDDEKRLALRRLTNEPQTGYLPNTAGDGTASMDEILTMPIASTETGEPVGALVLGFAAPEFGRNRPEGEIRSGIWVDGRMQLPGLSKNEEEALNADLYRQWASGSSAVSIKVRLGGASHLLFYKRLNPGSLYPEAYEIAVYPLASADARLWQIRRQVIVAGAALLALGLLASHFVSRRLSKPVEKLAVMSEEERAAREKAQAALATTSAELQRSERFSADASHQLKTPVTVLRAGLEELLSRDDFSPKVYDELSALLHQTYRITGVINDLLLLSRMDAGRLQIQFEPVNLSELLADWMDDISALPDDLHVHLKTNIQPNLMILGEKGYIALIVQNLLENARKYNIAGGEMRVAAEKRNSFVYVTVENTGRAIPPQAQAHIFERFHRGGVGENVPGHGLGLNLARELARLHGGDLRLVKSDAHRTEFEVSFRSVESRNNEKPDLVENRETLSSSTAHSA
jgi:signal transduction histidine kinase